MSIRRYHIESSGCIRIRNNLEIKVYGWNIQMKVRDSTSESGADHFHVAWGRVFNTMHSKFGSPFCNAYGTRIRSDMHNAIRMVTEAYYCVESASADYEVKTEKMDWKTGEDFQVIDINVEIVPLEDSHEA